MVGIGPKIPPARKGRLIPDSIVCFLADFWAGSIQDVPQNLLAHIQEFENIFTVDTAKLKEVVNHFEKELEKGM